MQKLGVPLPESQRTVLHDDLSWEEIEVGGGVQQSGCKRKSVVALNNSALNHSGN